MQDASCKSSECKELQRNCSWMFLFNIIQNILEFTINFIDERYLLRVNPGLGFLQNERKSPAKVLTVTYHNAWDAMGFLIALIEVWSSDDFSSPRGTLV